MVDINITINSYQIGIPVFALSYKVNNIPVNNIPLRLPVVLMKFCNAVSHLDTNSFIQGWNEECRQQSEAKTLFNIDFN